MYPVWAPGERAAESYLPPEEAAVMMSQRTPEIRAHMAKCRAHRRLMAESYQKHNGWDFFMVDGDDHAKAFRSAAFHIESQRDIEAFVNLASDKINWKPNFNTQWSAAARGKAGWRAQ